MYAENGDKYNMKRIMIFGGTTEGRELAERLAEENIFSTVFVATGYGEQVMESSPCIEVKCGRLGVEEMREQMESGTYAVIVDATHPFAQIVSENIRLAANGSGLPIFRCVREALNPEGSLASRYVSFDSAASCAKALAQTSGTILLTTGSKELPLFCSDASIRARLFVRVLPGKESLALCYENGLEGKQIMAMQGPFSEEMNLALIRQTGARILVTKESGHTGGTDAKITAAEKAGIACYLIRRPDHSSWIGDESMESPASSAGEGSVDTLFLQMREFINVSNDGFMQEAVSEEESEKNKKIRVTLVGTGMGSPDSLTGEAAGAIRSADYVLGAPRMIRPYQDSKIVFPFFTVEKVIDFLRSLPGMKGTEKSLSESGFKTGPEIDAERCAESGSRKELKQDLEENLKKESKCDSENDLNHYSGGNSKLNPSPRLEKETGHETIRVAVLFSGDSGFYSGAQKLYDVLCEMSEENPNLSVRILPGISSVSALSARTGYSWQDARIFSTHGVPENEWRPMLCEAVRHTKKTFVLTSGDEDVRNIGRVLCESGLGCVRVFTGFQLSYEEEKIPEMTPAALMDVCGKGLYTLLIVHDHPEKRRLTQGVPDEAFDRIVAHSENENSSLSDISDASNKPLLQKSGQTGIAADFAEKRSENSTDNSTQNLITSRVEGRRNKRTVPMTKEEIRDISIARLHLTEDAVVYDVGCGTGSVTCEIARLSPRLKAFAFECRPEAADLTRHNAQKFHLQNVTVVEEKAPHCMEDLPAPTHVFIGGSGGNLREILLAIRKKSPSARVVLNAVSLETVSDIMNLLPELGVQNEEIIQVSVSRARKAGRVHLMQAGNPVFIISFDLVAGTHVPAKR